MKRLIRTEFNQLSKSVLYRWLLFICFLIALNSAGLDKRYTGIAHVTGYEWFCTVQLTGGIVLIPICIFAADYGAGAFANRTCTADLTCGFTRRKIFGAKVIVYLIGLVPLYLMNTIIGTFSRTIQFGFGAELNLSTIMQMLKVFTYYIMTYPIIIGMFFFMWAVITRSRVGTIGFGLGTLQIIGSITSSVGYKIGYMKDSIGKKIGEFIFQFNPLYQIHSLMKPELFKKISFQMFFISAFIWFGLIILVSMRIFERREEVSCEE